jgi:hypothetical protein
MALEKVRTVTNTVTGEFVDEWKEVEHPVQPDVVPPPISDRQFFQQLAVLGTIPRSEALAAVKTGTIPTALQVIVDLISDEDLNFEVDMLISGATLFYRDNIFVGMIGAMLSPPMSSEDLDAFWMDAAKLG